MRGWVEGSATQWGFESDFLKAGGGRGGKWVEMGGKGPKVGKH